MRRAMLAMVLAVVVASCSATDDSVVRVYTSVTQGTVDAVVAGFSEQHPDVSVEVFRAPTGELTARIAAEERSGGLGADVLWLTDPLSIQQYDATGLLRQWEPAAAAGVPAEYQSGRFWGTRILTMVMIVRDGIDPPGTWRDLTDPRFAGRVAFPDPGFAGSSLAVLGYFAATDGYGLGFYESLSSNGAVQVNAPGEVVTGVAEGRFDAGITLAFSAHNAIENGSPISIAWPDEGAIALYSPIAVTTAAADPAAAEAFVEFTLGDQGQRLIAGTGWQPVIGGWDLPGTQVSVDWADLFGRQQELLDDYRSIFGG